MTDKKKVSMWLSPAQVLTLRGLGRQLDILAPTNPAGEGSAAGVVAEIANLADIMGTLAMPGPTMAELLRPYLDELRDMRRKANEINAATKKK